MADAYPGKAPWHLWAVGTVSLAWNGLGALDYTMTELGNRGWLESAGMGAQELAYIESFPAWAVAGWAIGVWFCVLGSVALLLRRKWAYPAFLVSLAGIAATTYFTYAYPRPDSFETTGALVLNLVLWAVTIALALYARALAKRGVLR